MELNYILVYTGIRILILKHCTCGICTKTDQRKDIIYQYNEMTHNEVCIVQHKHSTQYEHESSIQKFNLNRKLTKYMYQVLGGGGVKEMYEVLLQLRLTIVHSPLEQHESDESECKLAKQ